MNVHRVCSSSKFCFLPDFPWGLLPEKSMNWSIALLNGERRKEVGVNPVDQEVRNRKAVSLSKFQRESEDLWALNIIIDDIFVEVIEMAISSLHFVTAADAPQIFNCPSPHSTMWLWWARSWGRQCDMSAVNENFHSQLYTARAGHSAHHESYDGALSAVDNVDGGPFDVVRRFVSNVLYSAPNEANLQWPLQPPLASTPLVVDKPATLTKNTQLKRQEYFVHKKLGKTQCANLQLLPLIATSSSISFFQRKVPHDTSLERCQL